MNKTTLQLVLVGAGAAAVLLWFARRQAGQAIEALGETGSNIGLFFSDLFDRRTLDEMTSDIDCNHFNRNTARGEDLYQRCIRGEL